MKHKRKKDNDYSDDRDIVEESQDVDDPPRQRVTRPDRVQHIAENKNTDCVAVNGCYGMTTSTLQETCWNCSRVG
ncbi:hypothetical protein PPTG_11787 [Phytophthora nicotianae INRA-310]|uniref:Uncharacterized protein n=1 Tax=Phytophthora nicotianae (strain INRA-310) TaxID=761204 RepID=W2Q933_PHYN3|nr:hypothetical protein PPTG_11787 [Phytophthora nicotianae INRA-310]ETN09366.1 hypothetical protein PPTG_11787 [Phytophthora nicotianae INRA-310]